MLIAKHNLFFVIAFVHKLYKSGKMVLPNMAEPFFFLGVIKMNSASRYPRAIELLPKYLFNRRVISLPQMSAARIAEAAGDSAQTRIDSDGRLETHPLHRHTVSNWLKELRLDRKSIAHGTPPLTDGIVSAWLSTHLTVSQAERLFVWSAFERFDLAAPAEKRPWHSRSTKSNQKRGIQMEKIKIPDVANLDNLKQQMPIDYQQHVSRTFFWVSENAALSEEQLKTIYDSVVDGILYHDENQGTFRLPKVDENPYFANQFWEDWQAAHPMPYQILADMQAALAMVLLNVKGYTASLGDPRRASLIQHKTDETQMLTVSWFYKNKKGQTNSFESRIARIGVSLALLIDFWRLYTDLPNSELLASLSDPIDALLTQQAPEQAEAVETALSKYLAERFELPALNFKKEDD